MAVDRGRDIALRSGRQVCPRQCNGVKAMEVAKGQVCPENYVRGSLAAIMDFQTGGTPTHCSDLELLNLKSKKCVSVGLGRRTCDKGCVLQIEEKLTQVWAEAAKNIDIPFGSSHRVGKTRHWR